MKRIIIVLVLGLFVVGLVLTPLLMAADRTDLGESKQTVMRKAPGNCTLEVSPRPESPAMWQELVGRLLLNLIWSTVGNAVIHIPVSLDFEPRKRLDPPPPNTLKDVNEPDDFKEENGWEEHL